MDRDTSLVRYVGVSYNYSCGYCTSRKRSMKAKMAEEKQNDKVPSSDEKEEVDGAKAEEEEEEEELEDEKCGESAIFGLWAHRLTISNYMSLLNRGWRRSGRYLYKPIMEDTCCPQYTIRLDVHKFRLSRTQKRALRAMLDFLKYDKRPKCGVSDEDHPPSKVQRRGDENAKKSTGDASNRESSAAKTQASDKSKPFEKKKVRRRRRAEERLRSRGVDLEEYRRKRTEKEEARRKTIQSFLEDHVDGEWKHRLDVRLVRLSSAEYSETFTESFNLYKKYQEVVHKDDELSTVSFARFLASSPLFNAAADEDGVEPQLGSYHQQYVLDGKIIAVGVIDILPRCLSSKYFYYDPDYRFLSLGTYSALREIEFTRKLTVERPNLHYYYMGFYLYDCPKMRYKGKFRPSELLCDKTLKWVPLTKCKEILDANEGKFSSFAADDDDDDVADNPRDHPERCVDDIKCLVTESQVLCFKDFAEYALNPEELREKLRRYVYFAGDVANEIVLGF